MSSKWFSNFTYCIFIMPTAYLHIYKYTQFVSYILRHQNRKLALLSTEVKIWFNVRVRGAWVFTKCHKAARQHCCTHLLYASVYAKWRIMLWRICRPIKVAVPTYAYSETHLHAANQVRLTLTNAAAVAVTWFDWRSVDIKTARRVAQTSGRQWWWWSQAKSGRLTYLLGKAAHPYICIWVHIVYIYLAIFTWIYIFFKNNQQHNRA